MCPDNETPTDNPTLAQDDKFRRTIEPSEGPNVDGVDHMVKAAHTRPEPNETTNETQAEPSASMEPVKPTPTPARDIEPSMPAPDAVPMPSPSAVREE